MKHELSKNELLLLELLRCSLTGREKDLSGLDAGSLKEVVNIAEKHSVIPLLYPVLQGRVEDPRLAFYTEHCIRQYYHLLILTRYYANLLRDAGIPVVVLKGAGVSACYPVPEYRKSGDVDLLLLYPADLEKARSVLERAGAKLDEHQHANHHMAFVIEKGIELELHLTVTEDFDSQKTTQILKEVQAGLPEHINMTEVLPGVALPVSDDSHQAFFLLLHMLQHFLRAGFGLKLLCDWVVFWNRQVDSEQVAEYLRLIRECGITGFSRLITRTCVDYLGLEKNRVIPILEGEEEFSSELCRSFLSEIFEAQEFGHSSSERMVVLRGTSPLDYLREFHHQMRLNYPRASKCVLLWPVLWMTTLARFLYNNHAVRKTSLFSVLKQAGHRSELMEELKLFVRN